MLRQRHWMGLLIGLVGGCGGSPAAPPPSPAVSATTPVPPAVPTAVVSSTGPGPEADDGAHAVPDRRPPDIPARFAKPLVFPKGNDNPLKSSPTVKVEPPTLRSLQASDPRCPEGVRTSLYVIAGGKTSSRTYEELMREPAVIQAGAKVGDQRPAFPLDAVAPGAKALEVWPCAGDPLREPLPSTMLIFQTGQGFGKLVPDAETRRPVVRNIAAIVVDP